MEKPTELSAPVERMVMRLRGDYSIPINDGCGPIDGKMEYERHFATPPIQVAAAEAIEQMAEWLFANDCPDYLHDLAAKVLDRPSLAHGSHDQFAEVGKKVVITMDEARAALRALSDLGHIPSTAEIALFQRLTDVLNA